MWSNTVKLLIGTTIIAYYVISSINIHNVGPACRRLCKHLINVALLLKNVSNVMCDCNRPKSTVGDWRRLPEQRLLQHIILITGCSPRYGHRLQRAAATGSQRLHHFSSVTWSDDSDVRPASPVRACATIRNCTVSVGWHLVWGMTSSVLWVDIKCGVGRHSYTFCTFFYKFYMWHSCQYSLKLNYYLFPLINNPPPSDITPPMKLLIGNLKSLGGHASIISRIFV